MVVTLEPCNHVGRTGPCTEAIIAAGITDVVYAVDDPHDPAAGGAATLRAAGVSVRSGLAARGSPGPEPRSGSKRWQQSGPSSPCTSRRPSTAASPPTTAPASGSPARSPWRTTTGSGAASTPSWWAPRPSWWTTPASPPGTPTGNPAARQPVRAVMGLRDIPDGCRNPGDRRAGRPPAHPGSRARPWTSLYASGVRHVMVEGGSRILSAFLTAGLVDELIVYLAPTLLGSGTPPLDGLGISTLADAQQWEWDDADGGAVRTLGRDLRLAPATATPPLHLTHNRPATAARASPGRQLMFTGIIAEQGQVLSVERDGDDQRHRPAARPRHHRGTGPRRVHRRQRGVPHRHGHRRQGLQRRRHGGDPGPEHHRRTGRRRRRQPGTLRPRRRAAGRPRGAGPCGRRRQSCWNARPLGNWERLRFGVPGQPGPLHRREGLHRHRRRLPHRDGRQRRTPNRTRGSRWA